MKLLIALFLLLPMLASAQVNITNIIKSATVSPSDYVLGTTGLMTRLLPVSGIAALGGGTATNLTPWTTNVSAAGYSLSNALVVQATNFYGIGTGISNLAGTNIIFATINSNKFDIGTSNLLALAGVLRGPTNGSIGTNFAVYYPDTYFTENPTDPFKVWNTLKVARDNHPDLNRFPKFTIKPVLYVSTTGNDATAVRDDYTHPWRNPQIACRDSLAGDIISIAAGTYWVTNWMKVPTNGAIIGAGPKLTVLAGPVLTNGYPWPMINPSDGSLTAGMTLSNCYNWSHSFSSVWGYYNNEAAGQVYGTIYRNAILYNCEVYGDSDALYNRNLSLSTVRPECTAQIWDCYIYGPYDCVTFFSFACTFDFFNCIITNSCVDVRNDCIVCDGPSLVRLYNCFLGIGPGTDQYFTYQENVSAESFQFYDCVLTNYSAIHNPASNERALYGTFTNMVFNSCYFNHAEIGQDADQYDYLATITNRVWTSGWKIPERTLVYANYDLLAGKLNAILNSYPVPTVPVSVPNGGLGTLANIANTNYLGGLIYLSTTNVFALTITNAGTGRVLQSPGADGNGLPTGVPFWSLLDLGNTRGYIDAQYDVTSAGGNFPYIRWNENFDGGEVMVMGTSPRVPTGVIGLSTNVVAGTNSFVFTSGILSGGIFSTQILANLSGTNIAGSGDATKYLKGDGTWGTPLTNFDTRAWTNATGLYVHGIITGSNGLAVPTFFNSPTNTPTDGYVLTATNTGGATIWKQFTAATSLTNVTGFTNLNGFYFAENGDIGIHTIFLDAGISITHDGEFTLGGTGFHISPNGYIKAEAYGGVNDGPMIITNGITCTTGNIKGNGVGITNANNDAVVFANDASFSAGQISATNAIFIYLNSTMPTTNALGGWLWNSNHVLYWCTGAKTNLISDGR